jgi:hypothetical protein
MMTIIASTARPDNGPAWVPCDCCGEYLCTIHETHAYECECPPIDDWEVDPYTETPKGIEQ